MKQQVKRNIERFPDDFMFELTKNEKDELVTNCDRLSVLKHSEKIKTKQSGKKRIVYAPSCFLDEDYLTDNQIEYVDIPYNLFQRR
jgi:hypothetical protein